MLHGNLSTNDGGCQTEVKDVFNAPQPAPFPPLNEAGHCDLG